MDLDRVHSFAEKKSVNPETLKARMESVEPLPTREVIDPEVLFADLAARIQALPGFDPRRNVYSSGPIGTWEFVVEPAEDHPLPLTLCLSVYFDNDGQAISMEASWYDKLDHRYNLSAMAISRESVDKNRDPMLESEHSARMLGLINESVTVAETIVTKNKGIKGLRRVLTGLELYNGADAETAFVE